MIVEPNAVSAARPIAMPIIRATVTAADAAPNACLPSASTAAAERGVTVSPKPSPKIASQAATSPIDVPGVQAAIRESAAIAATMPDERGQPEPERPQREPRDERARGRRGGERPERDALQVGAAVQHPIDEHGAADDRRGETVARQERDEGRRRERAGPEPARVDERLPASTAEDHGGGQRTDPDEDEGRRGERRVDRQPVGRVAAGDRDAEEERREADRGRDRTRQVEAALAPGRRPAGHRRPAQGEGGDPDRDVEVEDVPPRRPRAGRSAPIGWIVSMTHAPTNGPAAIPRNVTAPTTPSARARAWPSYRCDAAAVATGMRLPPPTAWIEPRRDQLAEARRSAGEHGARHEDHERDQEHPAHAVPIGELAGQRHDHDRDEQVAVDDPGRGAELGPVGEVDDDHGQRDRGDHQLEAGQERPDPDDGQEEDRQAPSHSGECRTGAEPPGRNAPVAGRRAWSVLPATAAASP